MGRPYLKRGIWWVKIKTAAGPWCARSSGERFATGTAGKEALQRAVEYRDLLQRRENDNRHALKMGFATEADLRVQQRGHTPLLGDDGTIDMYLGTLATDQWRAKCSGVLRAFVTHADLRYSRQMGALEVVDDIEAFLKQDRRQAISSEWIHNKRTIIRKFNRWLWIKGYCREYQAEKVELIDGDDNRKIEHRALEPAELEALTAEVPELFAAVVAEGIPTARRMFYDACAWTGLRGEEWLGIIRSDLDLSDKPTITIREEVAKKNGLACKLPLSRSLAKRLHDAFGMMHPTARLFASLPTDRKMRLKWLRRDCLASGVDPAMINQRTFRMTHETYCRRAGLDDTVVGTLRRDKGEGTALLRRWHYTDMRQLIEPLRREVDKVEAAHRQALAAKTREASA